MSKNFPAAVSAIRSAVSRFAVITSTSTLLGASTTAAQPAERVPRLLAGDSGSVAIVPEVVVQRVVQIVVHSSKTAS